ncbi:MAG: CHASE2 domain-containing protein [Hyphomicrobiales bacterium]|nr:CHASE2 domain-containing protein [Hyphomicrobiales bacterium]
MSAVAPSSAPAPRSSFAVLAGTAWAAVVAASLFILSQTDLLPEGPDEWTHDWRTLLFSDRAEKQRDDIAVVLVSDDSLARYPYRSPIDRALLARAIRGLDAAGVRAIGVDVIFDQPTEPEKDQALIKAAREARAPIVFGATDGRLSRARPEALAYQREFLAATGRPAGHIFFGSDLKRLTLSDRVVRRVGKPSTEPDYALSFAEQAARAVGANVAAPAPLIDWLLPPDEVTDAFLRLPIRPHEPAPADADPAAVIPPEWTRALAGKIVLLGGDFADRDTHLTPLNINGGERFPGVMIHAQILAQTLDGRALTPTPRPIEAVALFLIAALGFYAARRWTWMRSEWIVYISGLAALILVGAIAFSAYKIIVPTSTLLLAWFAGVWGGYHCDRALGAVGVRRTA